MWKFISGFMLSLLCAGVLAWNYAGALVFREQLSPYGVEETAARIQQNIQNTGNGWTLIGLRDPAKAVQNDGGNILPVLMIEACSTKYSGPILKNDEVRFLSILIPCKISVYKKDDGKTYIGLMNAELIGKLFGSQVAEIMVHVAADQARFVTFDPGKPVPKLIRGTPGAVGGAAAAEAAGAAGGC